MDARNRALAVDSTKGWASLTVRWDRRAQLAAEWLVDARSVLDIGCGTMALRDFLSPGTRYIGVDIVARDAETIVVNLDDAPLPLVEADAAVVLGVVEYLASPRAFLPQLRRFAWSIVSYNHASVKDLAYALKLRPKRVDWTNHVSAASFRASLESAGLRIAASRTVRLGETLYRLAPR